MTDSVTKNKNPISVTIEDHLDPEPILVEASSKNYILEAAETATLPGSTNTGHSPESAGVPPASNPASSENSTLEAAETAALPDSTTSDPNPASSACQAASNLFAAAKSPAIKPLAQCKFHYLLESTCAVIENYLHNLESFLGWIWTLRTPLFLLLSIAIAPKMILLWTLVVITKPICSCLYSLLPTSWKHRFDQSLHPDIKNSTLLQEIGDGAEQGLPFILFCLYLFCAPFALAWMGLHWIRNIRDSESPDQKNTTSIVFTQNKKANALDAENNFYHSKSFGIVTMSVFLLGIPAFLSYEVYENSGVERYLRHSHVQAISVPKDYGYPAKMDNVNHPILPEPLPSTHNLKSPEGTDCTVVIGYNGAWPWLRHIGIEPNNANLFFVHFYLFSIGTTLCVLFFRAWFLFPLNFLTDEHDVELTESGIKRKSMKSWFLNVITINRWAIGGGPDALKWSEIKGLRQLEEGFTKLCPLPETAFKKESLTYKLLNKCAAFVDGLSNRLNTGNYLIFSCTEAEGDFGRNIRINLNDLNREQRAKLFYAVKKWAPHVVVQKAAEEKLLGSTVLKDNRYTQLWFDMLTSRSHSLRKDVLNPGETLKNGEYTIDRRISSGGQATAYLAKNSSGEDCVLKEFILAASSSSGALLESAREFEAEVSLLSQLSHDGIVKLQDFFAHDRRVYVVLEYIDGQSLRQKVQQSGPLSEREVVQIAESMCDVLEYLHGCIPPIVHRDITPENILIRPDGTVKLIDFSLAVKQDGRATTDSCAKQCFTPPEQFREEACPQSDIYSLGATMSFLLTGITPKPISVSSPKSKMPEISDELSAIVERATQLDLTQRYESVHWLKLDLNKLLD